MTGKDNLKEYLK